jgi:hypothetical protein
MPDLCNMFQRKKGPIRDIIQMSPEVFFMNSPKYIMFDNGMVTLQELASHPIVRNYMAKTKVCAQHAPSLEEVIEEFKNVLLERGTKTHCAHMCRHYLVKFGRNMQNDFDMKPVEWFRQKEEFHVLSGGYVILKEDMTPPTTMMIRPFDENASYRTVVRLLEKNGISTKDFNFVFRSSNYCIVNFMNPFQAAMCQTRINGQVIEGYEMQVFAARNQGLEENCNRWFRTPRKLKTQNKPPMLFINGIAHPYPQVLEMAKTQGQS